MKLYLFTAATAGDATNCLYPNRVEVSSANELQEAVRMDHVCAEYKENRRSTANFVWSNVIVMDCDNDHTENPADWITPEELDRLMPDIRYAIAFSRHHMIEKDGRTARPKFHVYFEIEPTQDADDYVGMKRAIYGKHPFFDGNALDAARFIFGADTGETIWHEGSMTIDRSDWITITEAAVAPIKEVPWNNTAVGLKDLDERVSLIGEIQTLHNGDVIPAGSRNSTLSLFAGKVLKCFGNSEAAQMLFRNRAAHCVPLLEDKELSTIWESAVRWYDEVICKQEGYIPPDQYNANVLKTLKPTDFSDVGETKIFVRMYANQICFSNSTDFLVYNGIYWEEEKLKAVKAMKDFLEMQLFAANLQTAMAKQALVDSGIPAAIVEFGGKKLSDYAVSDEQKQLQRAYLDTKEFYSFIIKLRNIGHINSVLDLAKPDFLVTVDQLDANPFLLNTPDATYNLKKGIAGKRAHHPQDYLTKCTIVSPGEAGKDLWLEALNLFFCNNQELIDYVQLIVGTVAVGRVYDEILVIAYGSGKNGKSTFWNTLARLLGDYSGTISADILTTSCFRNTKPEIAELKGKRLVIASELEEDKGLSSSVMKHLCTVDSISGEKKYLKPFSFEPTHSIVLYTNFLPRIESNDNGTWRRVIVIPFQATITASGDIKNYSDHLVKNAGPYIMSWIIEGAKKASDLGFKFDAPKCVQDIISEYREDNDWLGAFIKTFCDTGNGLEQPSGQLYEVYHNSCLQYKESPRSKQAFYSALKSAGYERRSTNSGKLVMGLKLKSHLSQEQSSEPF